MLRARGVTAADFNEDGHIDVYVSNYRLQGNLLWINDGSGSDFPFTFGSDTHNALGGHGHSIGSAFGDLDSDGHIDIFAGNFAHPGQPETRILLNQGPSGDYHFSDLGTSGIYWKESWSSPALADFDNDGMLDAFFTALGSYGNESSLFRNTGSPGAPQFSEVGFPASVQGYAVSWADWDNDGDMDLATERRFFRNDNNNGNSWLKVALRAPDVEGVNGAAIGAIGRITTDQGLTVTRQVESGTGQGNQNEITLHFGLGNHTAPVNVEITWPDGTTKTVSTEVNRLITVLHDDAQGPIHQNLVDVGEVGIVDSLTHNSQTVLLQRHYDHPVVFAQPLSYEGNSPSLVRVENIQSDRFDVFVAKAPNDNGIHNALETASYIVMEAGSYALADGTRVEVGSVDTARTVGKNVLNSWETIDFNTVFSSTPVVLSQVQTHAGTEYLTTRHLSTTPSLVRLALEQEEIATTSHQTETVGYLAIDLGLGDWNGLAYEAGLTPTSVTHAWFNLGFTNNYSGSTVSLLSSLASTNGGDSAHLRYQNLQGSSVEIKIEEDTTADTETLHFTAEQVAYLAIGGQGILTAQVPEFAVGEVKRITNLTHEPQLILLNRQYRNPVVFAQSASYVGDDPVAVRVSNVQSDRFTIQLTEPSDENGIHGAAETVTYVVLEAGTHQLLDGTRLEVGTVTTDATVGRNIANEWDSVHFATTFTSAPVIFSQIQTMVASGQSYLQTRQDVIPDQAQTNEAEVWDMEFTGDGDPQDAGFSVQGLNSSTFNFDDKFTNSDVFPGWMTANGNPGGFFYEPQEDRNTKAAGWTAEWRLAFETNSQGLALKFNDDTSLIQVLYDDSANTVTLEDYFITLDGNQESLSVFVDLDNRSEHTYRLVRQPASPTVDLYIDDSLVPVASIEPWRAASHGEAAQLNRVEFAHSGLNAAWDFFRYHHGAPPPAVSFSGFQLALESEQAVSTQHVPEQVGYLAIEAGKGTWNGMSFEVDSTPISVTDQWYDLSFAESHSDIPSFLSSLTTYNGSDNAHIRYNALDGNGVQLKVGEDTTFDTEVGHTAESVAYLTIGGEGSLTAITPQDDIGEIGRITDLTHQHQTVFLERSYANPVVFAQSPTETGTDPVAVRVTDVQSDRFTIYLAEPSNLNGLHNAAETVSYMVFEAGTHELVNGAKLEVGTVITDKTVGILVANERETVVFASPFNSPVVFSQIQTDAGGAYLHTRHLNVTPTSVELGLEQEEGIDQQHGVAETVGYLAIDSGAGSWTGLPFEVFTSAAIVTDQWESIEFAGFFQSPPHLLSSMVTYNGADNAHVRYGNLDESGVQFKIAEDTTHDAELLHGAAESVAYLAVGGNGILTAAAMAPTVVSLNRNSGAERYDRLDTISIVFDGHVFVGGDELTLSNASVPIDLSGYEFDYDATTSTGTWDFTNVAGIAPAWYTATLDAANVTGMAGLGLDGDSNGTGGDDYGYTFLVAKAGDADTDGDVDITDAKNLIIRFDPSGANSGNNWSRGNFDSDADIDTTDFSALTANFPAGNYAELESNLSAPLRSDSSVVAAPSENPLSTTGAGSTSTADTGSHLVATDRVFADSDSDDSDSIPSHHMDDEQIGSGARRSLRRKAAVKELDVSSLQNQKETQLR